MKTQRAHHDVDLSASDLAHMTALAVTIHDQRFDRLAYCFVPTRSNQDAVSIASSESFETQADRIPAEVYSAPA
jgi:hypothetical protein